MVKLLVSTAPEYRILMAVQPIFDGDLHWSGNVTPRSHHEIDKSDSSSSESDESSHEASESCEIGQIRDDFQNVMNLVRQNLNRIPDIGVSERKFQNCVQKMSELLKFLNSLVKGDILKHNSTSTGTYSSHPQHSVSSTVPTSPPFQSRIATAPPRKPVRTHRYKRLEAMEMILVALNQTGQDSTQICRDYICLSQSSKYLNKGIAKAQRVNLFLDEVVEKPKRSPIRVPETQEIPVTIWENKFAWKLSNLLFKRLSGTFCEERMHTVKFQLDGLRLGKSSNHPLVFDMFLSPCEPTNHWQETRCTSAKECK